MSEGELQRLADLYDRAEANKKRSRRALFIAIMTAVVVAFAIPVGLSAANLAQDNKELLEGQRMISARADCRSEINAELQTVKDRRFNIVLGAVFSHQPPGTPLTEQELAVIVAANREVDALPTLPEAVENGATINGEHFDACPKVA